MREIQEIESIELVLDINDQNDQPVHARIGDYYKVLQILGQGGFGFVCKVQVK